ncbi:oxygen-dependent coproporphyrinogen oxidase [Temperatibacter marinus]|uniref:coproporphyrinogen oxidase n=2 Tax=Temperatibacter marinus TaxID=1456591 RepID=A0AA52EAA6_9PROT|nr:oxygen-dependent coproporphyrinogen oxidase [Temperatibacter marinus]WND01607.1 oxygen-dependent coproporphyrinogen oxidase [Temperatibacter marinus]
MSDLESYKVRTKEWFEELRNQICASFEAIEKEAAGPLSDRPAGRFDRTPWDREDQADGSHGGGGVMSIMRGGRVFEKVGVNVSTVHGTFTPEFAKNIPGADQDPRFFATGISLVAHMNNPKVPAVHMNTRFIATTKHWFGGGADLNAALPVKKDTSDFHKAFKAACDAHNPDYYPKFKKWCDDYFYIKHRKRARGEGGIFYDQHNTGTWEDDFAFTQDIGKTFNSIYPELVRRHMNEEWTTEEREELLKYRGYYAEFNLVYDRGTTFGLKTNGNVEAILMSLPPEAKWP